MDAVTKSHIEANQQDADFRRKERERAYNYYMGRTKDETSSCFIPTLIEKIGIGNNNITKRIINRISLVYMVPPVRDVEENDKYTRLTKRKNGKLQRAEKMTELLGLIAVKVTNRNGSLDYDIIRDFVLEYDANDPLIPTAIHYPLAVSDEVLNTNAERWAYWSDTEHFTYTKQKEMAMSIDSNPENPENINPYGILPFIFTFRDGKPESTFTDVDPVNDIIETNYSMNIIETNKNANIHFQSFGYPWISGANSDGQTVGQDHWLILPQGASVGIESPPNTIESITADLKYKYQSIANNYGLDSKFVEGSAPESGVAMKMRNQELLDNRKHSIVGWRENERALYAIERVILKVEYGLNLPETISIDFSETQEILTPQEQREKEEYDIKMGYTTPADILFKRNPDGFADVAEAEAFIIANKEATATMTRAKVSNPLFDAFNAPVIINDNIDNDGDENI